MEECILITSFWGKLQKFSEGIMFDLECTRWMNGERKEGIAGGRHSGMYMKEQGGLRNGNY